MGKLSEARFVDDVATVWDDLVRHHLPAFAAKRVRRTTPDDEARAAYQLYSNALSNPLNLLVLGTEKTRFDQPLLANFGTTAVTSTWKRDRQAVPEELATTGSILAEQNWWPLQNFAWLLGGVHAGAVFHLHYADFPLWRPDGSRIEEQSARPPTSALWDAKHQRPRVLGQELLSLQRSGYRRVAADETRRAALGDTFMPVGPTDGVLLSDLVRTVTDSMRARAPFLASINAWLDDPADPARPTGDGSSDSSGEVV